MPTQNTSEKSSFKSSETLHQFRYFQPNINTTRELNELYMQLQNVTKGQEALRYNRCQKPQWMCQLTCTFKIKPPGLQALQTSNTFQHGASNSLERTSREEYKTLDRLNDGWNKELLAHVNDENAPETQSSMNPTLDLNLYLKNELNTSNSSIFSDNKIIGTPATCSYGKMESPSDGELNLETDSDSDSDSDSESEGEREERRMTKKLTWEWWRKASDAAIFRTSGSFENSYIPENPRTLKPLTFLKNRLRFLFQIPEFFYRSLYDTYLKVFVKKTFEKKRKKKVAHKQKLKKNIVFSEKYFSEF
ncbi:hypothetical protein LXL04_020412 [Taraxacum kok-saghyz]